MYADVILKQLSQIIFKSQFIFKVFINKWTNKSIK